ncbi:MAG: flap endonuclease-1 [Candidatus Bathyarchaeota archaeon]|nr:MAG: flap endonuclease-1 [Candidatus Bathyarchaeota archaeon]
MGVNLTPIIVKRVLTLKDLRGKSLAVDANNYLYQFLSVIRSRDGRPLTDSRGNTTSHLAGLMFRSTRLMRDFDMNLTFVFDGQPPKLKEQEIKRRRRQRKKALEEWQEALKARDFTKAFSKAIISSRLTQDMIDDAKKLLLLFGIPFVQAPGEAEAQASYMAMQGDVWAASTKDYDSILFGTPRLVRFLTIYGQEYLPSKGIARPLRPELITLSEFLSHHQISQNQLVDIAILVGTDFNEGIKGVGPKTALKLIKEFEKLENLPSKFLSRISPNFERVREIYLHPEVAVQYNLNYGPLREEEIFRFLCDQRDFARKRVEMVVQRLREIHALGRQQGLDNWVAKRP